MIYTIRRKYSGGGDVWIADADDLYGAKERARLDSETFPHGAVYVKKQAVGAVMACYVAGLRSSWAWWSCAGARLFVGGI